MSEASEELGSNRPIPVKYEHVRKQLDLLAQRATRKADQETGSRPRLYLNWSVGEPGQPATSLGLYAKWLVLLGLLFEAFGKDYELRQILEDGGARNDRLLTLFHPEAKKLLQDPTRYDPTRPIDHNELDVVLIELLKKFNQYNVERGRPELKMKDFVSHEALLQPGLQVVGFQPLMRFRHWLMYRQSVANPPSDTMAPPSDSPTLQQARRLVERGLDYKREGALHRVIFNCVGDVSGGASRSFVRALKACVCACTSESDEPFLPVTISLASGASRRKVVKELFEQVCPDSALPQSFDSRSVDLAADLDEIRQALTCAKHLIIFDGWDNSTGPFSALRDYLCDTHWAELIRALIQPSQNKLLTIDGPCQMRSRVVVLSTIPVEELRPWTGESGGRFGDNGQEQASPGALSRNAESALDWGYSAESSKREAYRSGVQSVFTRRTEGELDIYADVALRLIAASVNGLQRKTLQRCLKQWVSIYGWTPPSVGIGSSATVQARRERLESARNAIDDDQKLETLVQRLLRVHAAIIEEVDDEELEGLSTVHRSFALGDRPSALWRGQTPAKRIQFRSRSACSDFVSAWRARRIFDGAPMNGALDAGSWDCLNFLLADEALNQATTQARHIGYAARETAQSFRRFVQAIYHGLACSALTVPDVASTDFLSASLLATTLPLEAERRYRYLYTLVYRQFVEAGTWQLGRAFGRSDLRLDLLTMFVVPKEAHRLLSECRVEEANASMLPGVHVPEEPLPERDVALRCDLLEALGRAGLDAGTPTGRKAVRWAISVLPGWRLSPPLVEGEGVPAENHRVNANLPTRGARYQATANDALKLRLDWLLSSGSPADLSTAILLCTEQLQRIGIDPRFLDVLGGKAGNVITRARANEEGVTTELASALEDALKAVSSQHLDRGDFILVSDILYRLADAYATQADNEDSKNFENKPPEVQQKSKPPPQHGLAEFASSCAVYWLADRMREGAAVRGSNQLRWPVANGRPTRYYVRVCMKLARMILDGIDFGGSQRAENFAHALLEHAQNRLGLFTRHHFRLDRERVSGLLLESARLRSWVRITSDRDHLQLLQRLRDSLDGVRQADLAVKEAMKKAGGAAQDLRAARISRRQIGGDMEARRLRLAQEECEKRSADIEVAKRHFEDAKQRPQNLVRAYALRVREQHELLNEATRLLDESERLLLSLGFQRTHVRRLFLERAKYATTLAKTLLSSARAVAYEGSLQAYAGDSEPATLALTSALEEVRLARLEIAGSVKLGRHLELADLALDAFESASSDDRFWELIHRRQRTSLASTKARASHLLRT